MTDLPRGGTETIAFGRGADGRADYLQMNVWALAQYRPALTPTWTLASRSSSQPSKSSGCASCLQH